MRVTERLASLFIEENLRDREVLAEGTNQFLEAQLEDARRRLVEHEKKLEEYRRQFAGQLPSQVESNLQVLAEPSDADSESDGIDQSRSGSPARAANGRSPTWSSRRKRHRLTSPTSTGAPTPAQQLAAAKADLAALQTRLKDDHPDVQRQARRVAELEQKAGPGGCEPSDAPRFSDRQSPDGARADVYRTSDWRWSCWIERWPRSSRMSSGSVRQVGNYQARVEAAPTRESEMTELIARLRDAAGAVHLAAGQEGRLENRGQSRTAADRRAVQAARPGAAARKAVQSEPAAPERDGPGAGLALGLLLIALLEYRDNSFKTDHEVMRVLSLPVLAVVPMMQSAAEKTVGVQETTLVGLACATTVVGVPGRRRLHLHPVSL